MTSREKIKETYRKNNSNVKKTAELLGIAEHDVYKAIEMPTHNPSGSKDDLLEVEHAADLGRE